MKAESQLFDVAQQVQVGGLLENGCSDGCHDLARFRSVFGFAVQEVECDGPSNGNGDDSQKTRYQCDVFNSCFSVDGFADAVGSESIEDVASMASMMASMAPMALMVLALMASMVWVTALKRRKLSNEMLRYSPLKTWLCFSTKQAWEADGSRSSRRVDVVKVKKELMGSQIWAMVVTWARMASMASMVASMASMVLMAPRAAMVLASAALKAPKAGVSALRSSKLSCKLLVYHPEDLLVRRCSYNSGMVTVVYELGLNSSNIWLCSATILAVGDD